jgi:hypothetical protein
MNNPLVVAVAGPKGAGKTSLCRLLAATYARFLKQSPCSDPHAGSWVVDGLSQYPGQAHEKVILNCGDGKNIPFTIDHSVARIISFASPLKQIAVNVLGIDSSLVYGDDIQKSAPTDYMWEKQHLWVRWINSPERRLIRTVGGETIGLESLLVSGIHNEYQLWETCASQALQPKGMRCGNMSVRELLQILGTDVFRNTFNHHVWIKALEREVVNSGSSMVLIDDVRFDGELEAVARLGGVVVRFEGCGSSGHERERGVSESAMKKCHAWVSIPSGNRQMAATEGVRLVQELHECRRLSNQKAFL